MTMRALADSENTVLSRRMIPSVLLASVSTTSPR